LKGPLLVGPNAKPLGSGKAQIGQHTENQARHIFRMITFTYTIATHHSSNSRDVIVGMWTMFTQPRRQTCDWSLRHP